jgi:hypothetical protein
MNDRRKKGFPAGLIPNREQRLKALKNSRFGLEEFVGHCEALIRSFAGKQLRYKVGEVPGSRTIRYYVSKGFMDRPARSGKRVLFVYRHLLQVLVIKKLQSAYFPLRKIAGLTVTSNDSELEEILLSGNDRREAIAHGRAKPSVRTPPDRGLTAPPAWSLSRADYTSWLKFPIHDCVELHVRDIFEPGNPQFDPDVVAARIMHVLSVISSREQKGQTGHEELPASPASEWNVCLTAAPPLNELSGAVVALITEGGLVPRGNPDRLESSRANRFLKYTIAGVPDLESDAFESIDRGWDTRHVNSDPDRLVPLDVMRGFEREKVIGKTHDYLYTTTGVAMSVDDAGKIGAAIASELIREGVSAAILTAT